jgi:hypothetical protein
MKDEIQYLQELNETHTRRLRILEQQLAFKGSVNSPPETIMEIEDIKEKIRQNEERIAEKIRSAGNGEFFIAEQVKEITGQYAELAQMERSITLLEGMVQIFKESFYTEHQDRTTKFLIGVLGTGIVLRFVSAIVNIISAKSRELRKKTVVSSLWIWLYIPLLYYAWRKLQELYSGVSDLDKMLQDKKEEFEAKKRELNKIFKVAE